MHKQPSILEKCGHMVEFLIGHFEPNVDYCGSKWWLCYTDMAMPCFDFATCFLVGSLSGAILVHKVFGAHPLALVTIVSLGVVGGDMKQL